MLLILKPLSAGHSETKLSVKQSYQRVSMLWTIAVILLILWALGLVTGYTISGFIHILIVIAIVAVLLRIISGRRVM